MLKKNNFSIFILIQIFFIFTIFLIIPPLFLKEKPGTSQTSYNQIIPLDTNHSYLQKINTNKNYLNSISVLLKNPVLKSTDSIKLEVQNSNYQTVRNLDITGSNIGDPSWVRFKFEPINSQSKDIFYLKITSNSPKDNLLYIYGDPKTQQINFQTTYKFTNFKESFQDNFNFQIQQLLNRSLILNILYTIIIASINIFIFFNL